jgi:DNA-binding NtrC family response regulator
MSVRGRAILVVEDEDVMREFVADTLADEGHEVVAAADGAAALAAFRGRSFDLVLLDMQLPDTTGAVLLERFRELDPRVDVVILTGNPELGSAIEAFKRGARDYLTKPVSPMKLCEVVSDLSAQAEARAQAPRTVRPLETRPSQEEMEGASPAIEALRRALPDVAAGEATVLIEGEAGTGKEVVAALIHRLSPRRERPFVPIDCGEVPGDLLESELFGHVRSAARGAVFDVPGLFLSAEGGTVLLDEVAEMPLSLQLKVLRVIEQRQLRPLGSARTLPVNVRLLASSEAPLEEAVKAGRFLAALYHRLNEVVLRLPPLRERPEDVLPLAQSFVRRLNQRFGRAVEGLAPEAEAALLAHPFPGNVRELEQVMERAYALGCTERIGLGHLPSLGAEGLDDADGLAPLERAERDALEAALQQHGQDEERAAQALGLSRRMLYRRLKQLRVPR